MPVGTKLGRYEVVKHLATGGMADLSIARASGLAGFERHVVIKHLRPEQAQDAAFVEMFITEARLAGALHHHNIVQVHDIGEQDGKHFFAMEYVHGEDVRKLLSTLSERREQIPIPHIVTIGSAVAAALHHAHEQRGSDRKPLNIVHRDVTPANIIVGYDGNVKVLDFGIAKAALRTVETQTGMLKGKVPYMAPEQCTGKPVDRRSDIFSLGIVLYELATVRRLFKGANEFYTMSAVISGDIPPPSKHRKDLPKPLEQIILKALARKPAERYQTADEMRAALDEFADSAQIRTSTSSLASYMRQLFGERLEPWLSPPDEDEPITLVDFDGPVSGVVTPPPEVIEKRAIPRSVATTRNSLIEQARLNAISSSLAPAPGAQNGRNGASGANGANGHGGAKAASGAKPRTAAAAANGARVPLPPIVGKPAVTNSDDTVREDSLSGIEDHREAATQSIKGPPRPNGTRPPDLPGLAAKARTSERIPTDREPTDPIAGELEDRSGFQITRVANPPPPPVIIGTGAAAREPTAIVTPLPRPKSSLAEDGEETTFTTLQRRKWWLTIALAGLVVSAAVVVVVMARSKSEVTPTPSPAAEIADTPAPAPAPAPTPAPAPAPVLAPETNPAATAQTAQTDKPSEPTEPEPGTTQYRPLESEKPSASSDTTATTATTADTAAKPDPAVDPAPPSKPDPDVKPKPARPKDIKPQITLRDPPETPKPTKPVQTPAPKTIKKTSTKTTKTTQTTKAKETKPQWDPNALFLKKK